MLNQLVRTPVFDIGTRYLSSIVLPWSPSNELTAGHTEGRENQKQKLTVLTFGTQCGQLPSVHLSFIRGPVGDKGENVASSDQVCVSSPPAREPNPSQMLKTLQTGDHSILHP